MQYISAVCVIRKDIKSGNSKTWDKNDMKSVRNLLVHFVPNTIKNENCFTTSITFLLDWIFQILAIV